MSDDSSSSVTALGADGQPLRPAASGRTSLRSRLITAAAIGFVVIIAIGSVVAWRALVGSPYSAAEAIPADADIVITVDFLQLRDLERVDRFIQAFADPMAQHGVIDAAPDLESAMREFDDVAEEELGFRFAEDALSWIGRSGAIALWVPDGLLDAAAVLADDVAPGLLVTLDVRDAAGASDFLDRMLAEARTAGAEVVTTTIDGVAAYEVMAPDDILSLVVALHDDRLLVADSTDRLLPAIQLDPEASVAQTDDFQQLASALGSDQLVTTFISGGFGERMADAFVGSGFQLTPGDAALFRASLGGAVLDDEGVLLRTATFVDEGAAASAAASWAGALPAGTYGFVNVPLPERFLDDVVDAYFDALADAGVSDDLAAEVIGPTDDLLGVSLLDEVLPQFGRELLIAVVPGGVAETPALIGNLDFVFAIGVADAAPLETALDNLAATLAQEGMTVRQDGDLRVFEFDPATALVIEVTADALYVGLSSSTLAEFIAGEGGAFGSEAYVRVDDATAGDGLVMFADIASILDEFVDDPAVRDILAPLVAVGVGVETDGGIELSEMRLIVDY